MIRIGVDIDDTLCDFIGPLNDYVNGRWGTHYKVEDYTSSEFSRVWSIPPGEAHKMIEEFIFSDIYRDYDPHNDSYVVLKRLKSTGYFEFYAISARDYRLTNVTEMWIAMHYFNIFSGTVLCNYHGPEGPRRLKTDVCKELGIKIFIDDNPDNITCSSIMTIVYDQPWNRTVVDKRRVNNWEGLMWMLTDHLNFHINGLLPNVLIGISGKLGSGKDTICNIIRKNFPTFGQRAFAAKVREVVSIITGRSVEFCGTREGKAAYIPRLGKTIGTLLQDVGKGMREIAHEDVWCSACLDAVLPAQCIITDVRFLNEVDAIESKNGIIIRVNGDPVGIRERNEDGRDLNHISETALDNYPFTHVIENNGTIEDLEREVLKIIVPNLFSIISL